MATKLYMNKSHSELLFPMAYFLVASRTEFVL